MANLPQSRDDLIAEIVRRYLSGQSIRTVAAGIQRSYGLVQRILKQAGVPTRAPGRTPQVAECASEPDRQAAMEVHPSTGAKVPKKPKKKAEKKMSKKDKSKKAKKADKAKKTKKTKKADKAKKANKAKSKKSAPKKAKKAKKGKKK